MCYRWFFSVYGCSVGGFGRAFAFSSVGYSPHGNCWVMSRLDDPARRGLRVFRGILGYSWYSLHVLLVSFFFSSSFFEGFEGRAGVDIR